MCEARLSNDTSHRTSSCLSVCPSVYVTERHRRERRRTRRETEKKTRGDRWCTGGSCTKPPASDDGGGDLIRNRRREKRFRVAASASASARAMQWRSHAGFGNWGSVVKAWIEEVVITLLPFHIPLPLPFTFPSFLSFSPSLSLRGRPLHGLQKVTVWGSM